MDWDKKNAINLVKNQSRKKGRTKERWTSQLQDKVVSFLPDDQLVDIV